MNNFLCRIFVKDYENTKDPQVRGALRKICGSRRHSVKCHPLCCQNPRRRHLRQYCHHRRWNQQPGRRILFHHHPGRGLSCPPCLKTKEHPYGHARIEYISGMIVSVLIVVVGIELIKSSADKIMHPSPLEFSWSIIVVLLLAIAIKIWQALFNINIGKRINSPYFDSHWYRQQKRRNRHHRGSDQHHRRQTDRAADRRLHGLPGSALHHLVRHRPGQRDYEPAAG